jgi:hypothetical protein
MDFSWDWGVKAGVGYNFEHDGWDAYLHYTFFDTNGDDKSFAGLNDTVIPIRGASSITAAPLGETDSSNGTFVYCTHAKSQYDFDFHSLDLELGRNFYVSKNLSLRPHFGVKAAWIDLEQITRYTGGDPVTDATSSFNGLGIGANTVHTKDKSNFRGVGPRTGFNTEWYLGRGFSLFGETSLAMVFGLYDVEHKERYSLNVKNNRFRIEANRHGFSPTIQFQMGMSYKTYFNDDRNHLTLRLGYDSQYWWRVNQTIFVHDEFQAQQLPVDFKRYSEDASLMGITFDARLDF